MALTVTAEHAGEASLSLTGGSPRVGPTQSSPKLCSRVRGRERWFVAELIDKPRWAAAVELVLRGDEGVESATANPLTGRVLVRFSPSRISAPIETLLDRALAFGPMSRREFAAQSTNPRASFIPAHLIAAELGCFVMKMGLFGGCGFTGAVAAATLCLHYWRIRQA